MNTILFFQENIKERLVLLTKGFFLTILFSFTSSNIILDEKIIDERRVTKEVLKLHPNEGKWYYNGQPFTGYAIVYHANGALAESVGYYKGKKEGIAQKWFANGLQSKESYYIENRLSGVVKTWWPNGTLSSESNYINREREGIQKKWYVNGQLARKTNIVNGQQEGLQQAWLENGKIYVNYETKNGRVFGLKRANLCYALKEENVQYNKNNE